MSLSRQLLKQATAFDRLSQLTHRKLTHGRIHDLRVLTRRIRSSVWVARQVSDAEVLRKLRRAMRKLGRGLGDRRMYDVALEDARAYGLDPESIRQPHALAGAEVLKRLKHSNRKQLATLLRKSAAAAESVKQVPSRSLDLLKRRLAEALRHAPEGKAEQHRLRIEAKKVRYVLELHGQKVPVLRELQRRLGRAHDLEVLQDLAGSSARVRRDEGNARVAGLRIMRQAVKTATSILTACGSQRDSSKHNRRRLKR